MLWEAIGQLPGLESLSVHYKGGGSVKHSRNLGVLDPRLHLPQRNGLTIDVQAPWIKEADNLPPEASLLFSLPQALREEIYDYVFDPKATRTISITSKRVLHRHDICTSLGFMEGSYYCCPESPSFRSPGYEAKATALEYVYPWLRKGIGLIGLLTTCKDTYYEANARLYSRQEFVFDHPLAFIGFMGKLSPRCRDMITKIRLDFSEDLFRDIFRGKNDLYSRFGIGFDLWEECWSMLDWMEGLKELRILIKTTFMVLPKGSKVDPRTCLKKTERLKIFFVETPWIERGGEGDYEGGTVNKMATIKTSTG